MTSIREVAKLAHVSPSTVSRALNGSGYVAEDTKAKVRRAVDELDYVPKIKMTQSSRSVKTIETEEVPDMDVQRKETLAVSERKDPDPAMENLEEKLEESLKNLDFHSR